MRNLENIGHIVRDKRGITSLLLSWKISAFCYCNSTFIKGKNAAIDFFLKVIIKFDYADIIYDKPNNELFCKRNETIQYEACLAITGAIQGTS